VITALPLLLGSALLTSPAFAQDDVQPEAQVETDDLRRELDALRDEVDALRSEREETRRELDSLIADGESGDSDAERVGFGQPVHVEADEHVREVVSFGHDVTVAGRVDGDAVSFGGNVVVLSTGRVDGDAVAFGGVVNVAEGGRVTGDRASLGMPGAAADLTAAGGDHHAVGSVALATDASTLLHNLYQRLVLLLSVAGAGVLVVGLFPNRVSRIAQDLEARPVRSAIVGTLATGFLGLFALLFTVLTLGLGIPVSAVAVGVLGLAWLLGFVGLCQAVGDRLPLDQRPHGRWLAFLVGVVLITFLGSLPWVGWLVVGAASIIGVGAALSTRFGGRQVERP
jgi:hypothetical protein